MCPLSTESPVWTTLGLRDGKEPNALSTTKALLFVHLENDTLMCMLKLKYLKYFKYAAKPMAGACMALAICDDGDDDMPALEA